MFRVLDILMLVIIIPVLLIFYFVEYPKNWRERRFIFGVRNREDFKSDKAKSCIDEIASGCRKQALIILISSFVIMGLILFIPDSVIRMVMWELFILADLIVIMIPYMRGNSEMKSLKTELGIVSNKGVSYTDLKSAGSVHAFKLSSILIPEIITLIVFIITLLNDVGVINIRSMFFSQNADNTLVMSGMVGAFLMIGLMMIPIAIYMDKIRNEVISEDSDINMNYNRAKKKTMADTNVLLVWVNTIFVITSVILIVALDNEFIYMILYVVYMLVIMTGLFYSMRKLLAIERNYRKNTTIDIDDDDKWILGSIYYNPDDKRLNVEKRAGFGVTVNAAHPVGRGVYIFAVLAIIVTLVSMVYVVVLSKTPMSVRIQDGSIICHHLRDEINVPLDTIEDPKMGEITQNNLTLRRRYGMEDDHVRKGVYTVNGESNCRVFMDVNSEKYITFKSEDTTYYINGKSDEETKELYEQLEEYGK